VFGTYRSPDYETPGKVIPATGTRTGTPSPQGTNTISYTLFLPAGAEPATGWPVEIFGHGFTDSKQGAPWAVASSLAHSGIATIAINVVGHGGGSGGNLTIVTPTGPTVIPDGGRGIDQDGNGTIDSTEGVNATAPETLVSNRDGLRQTVIDLMQLVREIEVGLDVDSNGSADLDAARIFYAGQSFGGIYGIDFVALEPHLVAGVANVPGGPIIEIARLSPSFRPLVGLGLLARTPSLYNAAPNPPFFTSFDENMSLRGEPIRIDTVPGASAIQELIDRDEWAQQSANPAALAPYVDHPVIVQFAKGDRTVPNPTTTAILRAGDLAGRATYFRNDIAGPGGTPLYANPHTFLTGIGSATTVTAALQAQAQIAAFFASNGTLTIDPDGAGPVFEVPISGPLPETTGF
jgi:dienelactone hydrolase